MAARELDPAEQSLGIRLETPLIRAEQWSIFGTNEPFRDRREKTDVKSMLWYKRYDIPIGKDDDTRNAFDNRFELQPKAMNNDRHRELLRRVAWPLEKIQNSDGALLGCLIAPVPVKYRIPPLEYGHNVDFDLQHWALMLKQAGGGTYSATALSVNLTQRIQLLSQLAATFDLLFKRAAYVDGITLDSILWSYDADRQQGQQASVYLLDADMIRYVRRGSGGSICDAAPSLHVSTFGKVASETLHCSDDGAGSTSVLQDMQGHPAFKELLATVALGVDGDAKELKMLMERWTRVLEDCLTALDAFGIEEGREVAPEAASDQQSSTWSGGAAATVTDKLPDPSYPVGSILDRFDDTVGDDDGASASQKTRGARKPGRGYYELSDEPRRRFERGARIQRGVLLSAVAAAIVVDWWPSGLLVDVSKLSRHRLADLWDSDLNDIPMIFLSWGSNLYALVALTVVFAWFSLRSSEMFLGFVSISMFLFAFLVIILIGANASGSIFRGLGWATLVQSPITLFPQFFLIGATVGQCKVSRSEECSSAFGNQIRLMAFGAVTAAVMIFGGLGDDFSYFVESGFWSDFSRWQIRVLAYGLVAVSALWGSVLGFVGWRQLSGREERPTP
ncbi:MAG: hypothetical protein OXF61_10700 [Acidimicrobiaceae bacterium]|nr:hypothetical protein [Acidimicrobiaceae bacterium]